MSDYIKREDAKAAVLDTEPVYALCADGVAHVAYQRTVDVMAELDNVPSADVAPVRHGRWYENDQDKLLMRIRCSICNKAIYSEKHFAYCPYCGARMDI